MSDESDFNSEEFDELDPTAISPEDIPEDTSNYVHCRICGRRFRILLDGHFKIVHNTTKEEYLKKYNLTEKNLVASMIAPKIEARQQEIDMAKNIKLLNKFLKTYGDTMSEDKAKEANQGVYFQLVYAFKSWDQAVAYYRKHLKK